MFQIIPNYEVKSWPAMAELPVEGGKVEKHKFTLDLVLIDTDEFNDAMRAGDQQLFKKVIIGWDGIKDKDGQPFQFNHENLKAAVKNPVFSKAALAAYMQASSGQAAEKN